MERRREGKDGEEVRKGWGRGRGTAMKMMGRRDHVLKEWDQGGSMEGGEEG